mgnify:CR=1 FL=1
MKMIPFLNKYAAILLSLAVFILYLISMPKTVALEDDGLFILSAFYNGVSHPPGYPLHSLLGYVFTHLPFGNPAANLHALSALFGALSIWVLWHIMLLITGRKRDAMIAGLALALSLEFWSQAIIAEVYTLNSFLFMTTLWIALHLKKNNFSCPGKIYLGLGLLIGLGISNHWPLYILASPGLAIIMLPAYRTLIKRWLYIVVGLAIGLSPWIWLYINSQREPFVSFLGPIDGLTEFISYIRRDYYHQLIDHSPSATWHDKWNYIRYSFQLIGTQLGLLSSIVMLAGLFDAFKNLNKRITLALLTTLLFTAVVLPLLLDYDSDWDVMIIFPPYLLIAYAMGAMFFAFGLRYLLKISSRVLQPKAQIIVIIAIFSQAFIVNWQTNYRADYQWAEQYAKLVLDTVKENAVIFVTSDVSIGPIGYLRYVENYRPDVTLIHLSGTVLNTRLFRSGKVSTLERDTIITEYVTNSKRPVYFDQPFYPRFGYIDHWIVFEYSADKLSEVHQFSISPAIAAYIDTVLKSNPHDRWTYLHKQILENNLISHLIRGIKNTEDNDIKNMLLDYLSYSVDDLQALSTLLLLNTKKTMLNQIGGENKWITLGWQWFAVEKSKKNRARFLRALGERELANNNIKKGVNYYLRSIKEWDHPKNKTYLSLFELCQKKIITIELCSRLSKI